MTAARDIASRSGDPHALTVAIVDAGVGNLGNVERGIARAGAGIAGIDDISAISGISGISAIRMTIEITADPARIANARALVLPGVGAFRPPREALRGALEGAIRDALAAGAWLLGICVGYQLLFETSDEFGATDGLALLPGAVRRLPESVPLPHIGWNALHGVRNHPLLAGIAEGTYMYFVHSYAPRLRGAADGPAADPFAHSESPTLANCTHGATFAAAAGAGRVFGAQFHPEKSGPAGRRFLRNFLDLANGTAALD